MGLYENYFTGDDGVASAIYGTRWSAQTFTPLFSHTITSVKLLLYRVGSPGTITVSITATDSNGHPTGADLCSGTTDGDTLDTVSPYTKREITLGAGTFLSAGVKYAIVVKSTAPTSANRLLWRTNSTGNYTGGNPEGTTNGGTSWTTYAGDNMFEEWGTGVIPAFLCRIAFDSAPYASAPIWDDVSSDLRGLSIRRGRQHALDRMEPGTVVVTLDNRHYNYYPNNVVGDYSPNVLPGKRLNISVYYNAVYEIFTGYITEYRPNWQSKSGIGAVMEITAVGLIGNLALLLINDGTGFVEELSGTRIDNVLDKLSVNIGRDLATGQSTMQASGALVNENAKEHSDIVQRSELGYVFEAGDGDIQFHDRHTRLKAPYVTSSATFSDTPGLMRYIDVDLAYDDKFIYNDVRIQAVLGTEQVVVDSTSGTAYGKRSLSRTGLLMMTDADALAQAQYLLSRYKDPALRAKSLLVYPDADPDNLYPKVLGFDIGHRITLQLSQADIDTDYHIEGVNHDWDAGQNKWVTKWQLSDADNQKYWVLGVVGFTEIGQTTRLAY